MLLTYVGGREEDWQSSGNWIQMDAVLLREEVFAVTHWQHWLEQPVTPHTSLHWRTWPAAHSSVMRSHTSPFWRTPQKRPCRQNWNDDELVLLRLLPLERDDTEDELPLERDDTEDALDREEDDRLLPDELERRELLLLLETHWQH